MEANKILSSDVLDLIFEGRNKDYGAYDLRKSYNRRITRALLITASVALLALLGSILASAMKGKGDKKVKQQEMTIQEVKQEDKKEPPPPPPPPPPKQPDPPKVEMKQFTPPVIKKDEEVEKPPPPQEELKDVKIDVKDEAGVKDVGIVETKPPEELKPVIEEKKPEEDDNKIFEKVEVDAKFPGGDGKWKQYLEKNLNASAPVDGGAAEGTYTVVIQFIVDKEGVISAVTALTDHGYGMEQEAMRVIKKGPNWTPAVQNGRSVKAYRKQPITFQVQSE
jgi:periplasmic protein TonB